MRVTAPERLDLPVSGITCAACARTIERTLSKTPGVERAKVNFATATATVEYDPACARPGDLVCAIENLGYGVPEGEMHQHDEDGALRSRLVVAAAFAAPVAWLGMAERSPLAQLLLILPVIFYAGAPFYTGAWRAARHRAANMNTLISLGTGAAFL